MKLYLVLFFITGLSVICKGQEAEDILLNNINVQIEATQAVNDMYNFKFEKAEQQFGWLKQEYPTHPLPYFLMGLSQWWKMVPNLDVKKYDERFLAYMDTVIALAERKYEQDEDNVEAAFFLSAAYGFKGRLYSVRSDWRKAAVAGKNALKYLDEHRGQHALSPEFLFGDALYNYYSVWIPENYPLLKPILLFFPNGDKQLGIKQLKEVAFNAFYTRTEAQIFLVRILAIEEKNPLAALPFSKYLAETFPDNPYFERYYARILYTVGRFREAQVVSLDIMNKIDNGMTGYGPNSGRYAGFFLGQIYERLNQRMEAKYYYQRAVNFGEQIDAYESGYYLYSLLNLGEMAKEEGKENLAKLYFRAVKKHAKRSHPAHKEAREYL